MEASLYSVRPWGGYVEIRVVVLGVDSNVSVDSVEVSCAIVPTSVELALLCEGV